MDAARAVFLFSPRMESFRMECDRSVARDLCNQQKNRTNQAMNRELILRRCGQIRYLLDRLGHEFDPGNTIAERVGLVNARAIRGERIQPEELNDLADIIDYLYRSHNTFTPEDECR